MGAPCITALRRPAGAFAESKSAFVWDTLGAWADAPVTKGMTQRWHEKQLADEIPVLFVEDSMSDPNESTAVVWQR
jgi:hypothetical protein